MNLEHLQDGIKSALFYSRLCYAIISNAFAYVVQDKGESPDCLERHFGGNSKKES